MANIKWTGYFEFEHYDKNGNLIWQQRKESGHNSLSDKGEENMLDVYFRGGTAPASFEIGLFNDTPVDTDDVADLTGEPSTNGYARQALARDTTDFPTLALDSGDYKVTSKQVTFSATNGSWGPVTHACLIYVNGVTKKLIAYQALSQSRTLADGEQLKVTYAVKLS
jgi:hypothetical protein